MGGRDWGGARLCIVVCTVLLLVSQTHGLHIRIPEPDMVEVDEPDTVEFPEPVGDDIAGAPGSAVVPNTGLGIAHDSLDKPGAACDMAGNVINVNDGEELATPTPTPTPVPTPEIWFPGRIHEFSCPVAETWPEFDPSVVDLFNLYNALSEGSNEDGFVRQITNCSCICTGINGDCGAAGTIRYYSEIPSPQACAQMMCHKNKFAKCRWSNRLVSRGKWVEDFVRFNSSVLVIDTHGPSTGLLDNFPSPSPSPSPSVHIPTPQELENLKAMAMINYIRAKTCTTLSAQLYADVYLFVKAVNMTQNARVTCSLSQDDATNQDLTTVDGIAEAVANSDFYANALAGFSSASVFNSDSTAGATSGMNGAALARSLLLQMSARESNETAEAGDYEAFLRVVRLFRNETPKLVQCGVHVPEMHVLLRSARDLDPRLCDEEHSRNVFPEPKPNEVVEVNDQWRDLVGFVPSTTVEFFSTVVERLRFLARAFSNEDAPPSNTATPGPGDLEINNGEPMETEEKSCSDDNGTDMVANSVLEDDMANLPGARPSEDLPKGSDAEEMPLFGDHPTIIPWTPKNSTKIVLTQPSTPEAN